MLHSHQQHRRNFTLLPFVLSVFSYMFYFSKHVMVLHGGFSLHGFLGIFIFLVNYPFKYFGHLNIFFNLIVEF